MWHLLLIVFGYTVWHQVGSARESHFTGKHVVYPWLFPGELRLLLTVSYTYTAAVSYSCTFLYYKHVTIIVCLYL